MVIVGWILVVDFRVGVLMIDVVIDVVMYVVIGLIGLVVVWDCF